MKILMRHSFKNIFIILIVCLPMCFVCMSVVCIFTCVCLVSTEAKEGIGSLRTGVVDGCEPPGGCWELSVGLLEEHQVFLTAEHFSSPRKAFLR